MTPLKEKIINYILKFISEGDREVRVSDLYDFIENEFSTDLQEECKNVPLSDGIYIDSTIRETDIVYGLTYFAENEKMIGLNKEGRDAAKHSNGITGYLDDKEQERKLSELRSRILFWAEIIATAVAAVGLYVDFMSPNTIWLNSLIYLAFGFIIGLVSARLLRLCQLK